MYRSVSWSPPRCRKGTKKKGVKTFTASKYLQSLFAEINTEINEDLERRRNYRTYLINQKQIALT